MRTFVLTALSALAIALTGMAPANAAGSWSCVGAEFVCGGGSSAKSVMTYAPKNATYAAPKAKKAASYDSYSAKPKKKSAPKVARSSDDDAPRKSKKSYSGGGTSGMASYYWQPQKVASGGWFNPNAMTAAHKTLPFGTKVRVTNQHNGQSVVVTINDRGPYVGGRIIDLSKAAAGAINMQNAGVVPVNVAVLGK